MARRRRRVRRIKYRRNPRRNPVSKLMKQKVFGIPVLFLGLGALGFFLYKKGVFSKTAALPAAAPAATGEYLQENGAGVGGVLGSRGLGSLG